jgi:hypothetical protein
MVFIALIGRLIAESISRNDKCEVPVLVGCFRDKLWVRYLLLLLESTKLTTLRKSFPRFQDSIEFYPRNYVSRPLNITVNNEFDILQVPGDLFKAIWSERASNKTY